MHLRTVVMLAPLVIASHVATASAPAPTAEAEARAEPLLSPDVLAPAVRRSFPVVPPEEDPRIDLDDVRWTSHARMKVHDLAMRWGMRTSTLLELNPELSDGDAWVEAGERLIVFRVDPERPTRSIGAPNRGRLRWGIPLPEGPHWKMRDHRSRAYGTRWTIEALLRAFTAYGARFPDGPPVHLGEISNRRGGRARPHVSHRTGRDVDIGYIHRAGTLGDRHWRVATEESFDVEKNWFLVKSLIETGRVQTIFVSSRLQRLLMKRAREELSAEEMARYFRRANPDYSEHTIIRYWRGHRDHMHVRFECQPGNRRCRSKSR